jgi:Uma2 family endonuclease
VELLFGQLLKLMGANPPHSACVQLLMEYFTERYFKQYGLRTENAIQLSDESLPQPDFAVVTYRADHYAHDYPQVSDVLLVVEVADSSLSFDRTHKTKAYAMAGIEEYWIVNLPQRRIELHQHPFASDGSYASVMHYLEGQTAHSNFAGEVVVADLLPPISPP